MIYSLVTSLLALLIGLPFAMLYVRDLRNQVIQTVVAISYHLVYVILIYIPIYESTFSIPGTTMNWSGKLLAIIFSVSFYSYFKDLFEIKNFLRLKPQAGSLRKVCLVGGITLMGMCLLTFAFSGIKIFNPERLAYQAMMPGLDEEIWRGILLGLLLPFIKDRNFKLGHPALWFTTVVFALGHSLFLEDFRVSFAADAFILTGLLGFVLGWVTLKSKSILPALILHNLINASTNFIEMLIL